MPTPPFFVLPSLQLPLRLPWCDAAAPATPAWLDAPGLSPLTLLRCATSPLIGKKKNPNPPNLTLILVVSCLLWFQVCRVTLRLCLFFFPSQWNAPTAGHQHLSGHPTCGFVLWLGPGILSAGSTSGFILVLLPGSLLSSYNRMLCWSKNPVVYSHSDCCYWKPPVSYVKPWAYFWFVLKARHKDKSASLSS